MVGQLREEDPHMFATLKRISIASGLLVAMAASAFGGDSADNQQTADAVAAAIKQSSLIAGQRVSIDVVDGYVTLKGDLRDSTVREDIINRTREVDGVVAIVDQLTIVTDAAVKPVQYETAMSGLGHETMMDSAPMMDGTSFMGGTSYMDSAPMIGQPVDSFGGYGMGGPVPEGPAGFSGAAQASNPGLPNYAWPSYAPYPNFSAVGYPTAYPWQAWPNIGPFHPYPEVPLDWRAVTLRWDDGIWFLDFKKHYTRPFFTPYPFGLFAY